MLKVFKYILIILLVNACAKTYKPIQEDDCYVPDPECVRTEWKGLPLDTSQSLGEIQGYYYKIERVNEINSSSNEYRLDFNKIKTLTYDSSGLFKVKEVLPLEINTIRPKANISFDEGHYGFQIENKFHPDKIYFSKVLNYINSERKQFHIDKANNTENFIRVPTEEMIGRSVIAVKDISSSELNDKGSVISEDLTVYDWESHPFISDNGKFMFFASTREGGYGSTDIWFRIYENDAWGEPINAGPEINSVCDEFSPFISNSTLLFSSEGFDGLGGLDIFSIEIEDEFWKSGQVKYLKKRKNLRPPINTEYDEWFASSPGDIDSVLYYSSNQFSDNFDIYVKYKFIVKEMPKDSIANKNVDLVSIDIDHSNEHDLPDIETPEKLEPVDFTPELESFYPPELEIKGIIIAENTGLPVQANITIKDLEKNEITHEEKTNDNGEYSITIKKENDIEVIAQNEDLFQQSTVIQKEELDTLSKLTLNFELPIELTLRINFPYDVFDDPYEYTLDSLGNKSKKKWFLEMDNVAANIKLGLDHIEVIKLVGHTDFIGSNDYNDKLGLSRVEFVKAQLIKRDIPADKIEIRSAGKREPLKKYSTESDEQYRKRLRRVTIKKVFE